MVRCRALSVTLALFGLPACTSEDAGPMPDFEWEGAWVTIVGYERAPEEACAGTFAYLDDYTGVLAHEFGVSSAPIGTYRWYSEELFGELEPCGRPVNGCTGLNGIFTKVMPAEHELVHLVHDQTTQCPLFLAEGLAEYYGTTSSTPASLDLGGILADPGAVSFDSSDYPLAGAFVAFLVERHGLEAILEVCERAGVRPTITEFDDAVSASLGVSIDQLAQEFASFDCQYSEYRSKLYECELQPSVEIGEQPVALNLTLDCADERTIGPRASKIWALDKVRVLADNTYLIALEDESGAYVTDEAGLEIAPCIGCGDSPFVRTYPPGPEPTWDVVSLDAADYVIKVWADREVSKRFTLRFEP